MYVYANIHFKNRVKGIHLWKDELGWRWYDEKTGKAINKIHVAQTFGDALINAHRAYGEKFEVVNHLKWNKVHKTFDTGKIKFNG